MRDLKFGLLGGTLLGLLVAAVAMALYVDTDVQEARVWAAGGVFAAGCLAGAWGLAHYAEHDAARTAARRNGVGR